MARYLVDLIGVMLTRTGILLDYNKGDKSIKNMDDKDWDLVVAVHLKGAFEMTKACWPLFRGQKVGFLGRTRVETGSTDR